LFRQGALLADDTPAAIRQAADTDALAAALLPLIGRADAGLPPRGRHALASGGSADRAEAVR
jgi:hypothetical protein